jgi:4-amino-4-deoxy-L-arabinose transferase-like glycosyltransferase
MRRRSLLTLAVPFVAGIAALHGLTVALPMFHGSDELNYHLPTIRQFSSQLPFPSLDHYVAAQTPLYHLLLAVVGRAVGFELWRLRLVEVLISYGLALAVYALLRRRLRLERVPALALTVLFTLSPYVYATSFRLLTDNLALLFSVLALERLERFRESGRTGSYTAAAAVIGAAILTRQSTAFLVAVAGLYALAARRAAALRADEDAPRPRLSTVGRGGLLAILAVACVPAAALFIHWHGLVPPGGDPASCGLCPAGRATGAHAGSLVVQTPELALATIGLYGAVLFGPVLLAGGRAQLVSPSVRGPLIGAAVGAILLLAFPARPGAHAAGLLWNAARRVPALDGSPLLFWILVPLAGAVLWARLRVASRQWLVGTLLFAFLAGSLATRFPWQKYVDPYALLALLLTVRPCELARPRELVGALALACGFVAYTLSFVV